MIDELGHGSAKRMQAGANGYTDDLKVWDRFRLGFAAFARCLESLRVCESLVPGRVRCAAPSLCPADAKGGTLTERLLWATG